MEVKAPSKIIHKEVNYWMHLAEKIGNYFRARKKEYSLPIYVMTFCYTLFVFALVLIESLNTGFYTPDTLVNFYLFLLTSYVGIRKYERKKRKEWKKRIGDKLVLLWCFTFLLISIASCLSQGRIMIPDPIFKICVSVVGLFVGPGVIEIIFFDQKRSKPKTTYNLKRTTMFRN